MGRPGLTGRAGRSDQGGVGTLPDIPNNSSTTTSIAVGGSLSNSLEFIGDHDWVRIELTAGQKITITLNGVTLEDPYLYLRDAAGNLLVENDDINPGLVRDSRIDFTPPTTGTYYIDIGAWDENFTGTYQLNVQIYAPPVYWTFEQVAGQLTDGYWGGDDHHFNATQGGSITVNITALTSAGQTLARSALALWSDIIGINFVEVTSGGQITFDDNETGAFSDGTWANGIISTAHVNVSTQWLTSYGTSLSSYSYQTYLHEIGHALGLGHAGMYNETASYADDALYLNDGWPSTVMSYFDQSESTYFANQAFSQAYVATPMLADVRAMATLYGLSTTTRTGDTSYGFNNTSGRVEYGAMVGGTITAVTIFDNGGIDTLNYSGFESNQKIDLRAEFFSNVGGGIGNVSIAFNTVIENATGGSGNDELVGNQVANVLDGRGGDDALYGADGDDTLIGGAGNDRLDGEAGSDTASYSSAFAGVNVNLSTGSAASIGGADAAFIGTDMLFAIENVIGSGFADTLTGDTLANRIDGGAGNDTISGGGGADVLIGGSGNDILTGGSAGDSFQGTVAGLSGDTITDLALGETIVLTDASLAGFSFSLTGNTLTFTGGSLTLQGSFAGQQLVVGAAAGGGVQLTLQAATAIADVRNDFNGDGRSDILWRSTSGQLSNWLGQANGGFTNNDANAFTTVPTDWQVTATGDFNGDGRDDILWRSDSGQLSNWLGNGSGGFANNDANAFTYVPTNWSVVGAGDFNGDGRDDILWRNTSGQLSNWLGTASGGFVTNDANAFSSVPTNWIVIGTGDFNGDGRDDILWRNTSGQLSNWLGTAAGGFVTNDANAFSSAPTNWHVVGTGDFNGDGRDDILWRSDAGQLSNWLATASGGFVTNDANAFTTVPTNWQVVAVGDYNGDGRDDILWRNDAGQLSNWLGTASGGFVNNDANAFGSAPTSWETQPDNNIL